MPGHYTFYGGSSLFEPLCAPLGLKVDQVNFVLSMYASVLFGVIYAKYASIRSCSATTRHLIAFSFGLGLCLFCYGPATKHLLADTLLCYVLLAYGPEKYIHVLVCIVSMSYLSFIHFYRVKFATTYVIDVTAPMMILTQKVLMLAFDTYDSQKLSLKQDEGSREGEQVNQLLKDTARPGFLQFMSYALNFQSVLSGPFSFYSDYVEFVEGKDYWSQSRSREMHGQCPLEPVTDSQPPSSHKVVLKKVCASLVFLFLAGYVLAQFPIEAVYLNNYSFFGRIFYLFWVLTLVRFQYYFAWIVGDAISNASGFGFNGYSDSGEARWNLVSNVDIWKVETSLSMRDAFSSWNINTMVWLRHCAYNRVSPVYRTISTYALSAWWHGFFPGYYIAFFSAALFTVTGRTVRRFVRPLILQPAWMKACYDVITFLATRCALNTAALAFVLLHAGDVMRYYSDMYFVVHVASALLLFLTPVVFQKRKVRAE